MDPYHKVSIKRLKNNIVSFFITNRFVRLIVQGAIDVSAQIPVNIDIDKLVKEFDDPIAFKNSRNTHFILLIIISLFLFFFVRLTTSTSNTLEPVDKCCALASMMELTMDFQVIKVLLFDWITNINDFIRLQQGVGYRV